MLLEIQLRNISLKRFQDLNFEERDTAALFAGQIAKTIPDFKENDNGLFGSALCYGVKFEFAKRANNSQADLTLSMELNEAASARFASDATTVAAAIKDMEALTCSALKFEPEEVTITAPSLRKE